MLVGLLAFVLVPSSASAIAASAPAWPPFAISGPTNLPPGGDGTVTIYVQNVGGSTSDGTITVEARLPPSLVASSGGSGSGGACSPQGPDGVLCTTANSVPSGVFANPIAIPVSVATTAQDTETDSLVTVSGGGGSSVTDEEPITISATPAPPGVQTFTSGIYGADGARSEQAGSHPFAWVSTAFVNTVLSPTGDLVPAGEARTLALGMPPGFVVNPTAAQTLTSLHRYT